MSSLVVLPQHPVLRCVDAISAALDDVAATDPVWMSTDDKEAALVQGVQVAARLEELRLRLLGAADDVALRHGARDPAAWLAHAAHLDGTTTRGDLALARTLERYPDVAAGLREGRIDRARAAVITRALDELPDWLPTDLATKAEEVLTSEGENFGPRDLKRLGQRILETLDHEAADDHERQRLENEEAHADQATKLTTRRRGDGTTDLSLRCPDTVADRLLAYLESLTSPRQPQPSSEPHQPASTGPDDRRPYPQRLGHAFRDLVEGLDPTRLPIHGGNATTIVVTIDLPTLLSGLGVALIGDQPITAAQARRLACQAHLLPAVLDGQSVILDQGRAQRLYTPAQRTAMAVRDVTCRAEGCTIPANWCEAHHLTPWTHGGKTDLDDGVLLCSHHHHRIHDHHYTHTRQPNGRIRYHRRT